MKTLPRNRATTLSLDGAMLAYPLLFQHGHALATVAANQYYRSLMKRRRLLTVTLDGVISIERFCKTCQKSFDEANAGSALGPTLHLDR
jgi:hypothetical protein